jgi:hypothetical protein
MVIASSAGKDHPYDFLMVYAEECSLAADKFSAISNLLYERGNAAQGELATTSRVRDEKAAIHKGHESKLAAEIGENEQFLNSKKKDKQALCDLRKKRNAEIDEIAKKQKEVVEDDFDKASEEIDADISFARATKTTLLKEQNLHRTAALDAHSNYQTAKENYEKNFVNKEYKTFHNAGYGFKAQEQGRACGALLKDATSEIVCQIADLDRLKQQKALLMINKLLKVFDGEESEPFEAQKGYAFGHQAIITARNGHSISDLRTLLSQCTGLEDPNHTASIAGSKRRTFEEVGQYESDHEYNRKKRRCNSKSPSAAIGSSDIVSAHDDKNSEDSFSSPNKENGELSNAMSMLGKATPDQMKLLFRNMGANDDFVNNFQNLFSPQHKR